MPHQRTAENGCQSRAVALVWLCAYLALSGLVLAAGSHLALVTLHVVLIAISMWSIRPNGAISRLVGDLTPLIVAPLLYGEIPFLIAAVGTTYHDASVQRWEVALFGGQASRAFAAAAPSVMLSELLHAGYLAYYLVIFVPPLILLARGKERGFAHTVLALTVVCTICWTFYVLWPVEGPRYLWTAPAPDGPIRRLALRIVAAGSSRGAAFPSSHMAVSAAQAVLALQWQRRTGYAVSAVALLVGLGAVYGGFHYGVDIVVGAIVGIGLAVGVQMFSPE